MFNSGQECDTAFATFFVSEVRSCQNSLCKLVMNASGLTFKIYFQIVTPSQGHGIMRNSKFWDIQQDKFRSMFLRCRCGVTEINCGAPPDQTKLGCL